MPTKARRSPKKKQPKKKKPPISANKAKLQAKLERARERREKRAERRYKQKLARLYKTGLYRPTTKTLTKARKAEINKAWKKFEEFLTGDAYVFVPIPTRSKKKLQKTIKLAKKNQLPTSQTGVFIPKTRNTKSATAVYSKKRGTYRIVVKKKKKGPTGSKTITEIVPLEPMGTLEKELERIREDADLLELKKGESLAFKVEIGGSEGYGRQIFSEPDLLTNYLQGQYHQAIAHKLQFFRAVTVFKTKSEKYFGQHPNKEHNPYKGIDRKGRSVRRSNKRQIPRSTWMTPFEQGYAAYNSGFALSDNPYPAPPEQRQWRNGWLKAQEDDKL